MPAQPSNRQFENAVRESFARQKLMTTIGARLIRVAPGEVDIELPWSESLVQQSGVLHAGVIASIADSACGYAALTLMPPDSEVVSIEFKLNLLAPAAGQRFVACGRIVRAGRTISVTSAEVFADDKLIATMTGTMMRRPSTLH